MKESERSRGDANKPEGVIGILYPGDMGSNLGTLLVEQGCRVVTTVAGRSTRTRRLAAQAGLEVLDSLSEVLHTASVILSLVPPTQAVSLARQCRCLNVPTRSRYFIDLNSISPVTAGEVAAALDGSPFLFVDGAVHGVASQLRQRGVVYLSGVGAAEVAKIFGAALRVKIISDRVGDASAIRMMFSGLTKGLIALFLEMALTARQAGFLDKLLECYGETYPALMTLVERLLPTYPQHAARRADEVREVEQTMRSLSLDPHLLTEVRRMIGALGEMDLASSRYPDDPDWTIAEVIEAVFAHNPLKSRRATLACAENWPADQPAHIENVCHN
jgi:3-hydroxyisobutyrate dehydrogenase-like beta-hydroxyacid dehydrogenase